MSSQSVQYSPEKIKKFETLLSDKLTTTDSEIDGLKENQKIQKEKTANTNLGFSENSQHFQQKAKNKQLIRRLQSQSRQLRAAIGRVKDGTYGVCERSGELIREERLLAMPTARFDIIKKK